MRIYEGRGLGDIYFKLIRDITKYGRRVTVRGEERVELPEPVALVYRKPGYCWMNIPKRRFNPFFALAEVYWILSGNGSAEWIGYYNKRMLSFRDGDKDQLHGAYGMRIREWPIPMEALVPGIDEPGPLDQIQQVIRKLRADPNSTQAVIALWDPVRDNLIKSHDHPCNNAVYYSLRDGVLDQTVVIRSNDAVWGTPYNAVQFTHLHALVAGMLEAKMGTLTYVVQNLHYYFDKYNETLANLIEHAHLAKGLTRDDDENGPGALIIPNFDVTTEEDLDLLGLNIDNMYVAWNDHAWLPIRQAKFVGTGYWCQTISKVLWIYRIMKEGFRKVDQGDKEYLAEQILTLGTPLVEMIMDFLGESKQEVQKDVVQICQRMSQPLVKG